MTKIPNIGQIVLYTLTQDDATQINLRRTTRPEIARRIVAMPQEWPLGVQAHLGNLVKKGLTFPMIIVHTWGRSEFGAVNGQVFLDGNDTYWATSRYAGNQPGTWHWQETA